MNVTYPSNISSFDVKLMERATDLLNKTITTTSSGAPAVNTAARNVPSIGTIGDVKAVWSEHKEHGHQIFSLTLSHLGDTDIQVSTEFYPSDLLDRASPPLLPYRIARLWGDLLEKFQHKQFQDMLRQLGQASNA